MESDKVDALPERSALWGQTEVAGPTYTAYRSWGDLTETYKIITEKYDKDCTEGLFEMREESSSQGNIKKDIYSKSQTECAEVLFPQQNGQHLEWVASGWWELPQLKSLKLTGPVLERLETEDLLQVPIKGRGNWSTQWEDCRDEKKINGDWLDFSGMVGTLTWNMLLSSTYRSQHRQDEEH